MPSLDYVHVDVFSDAPFGGNSLPVFYDAPDLSAPALLRITQELRHFEAVFLRPAGGDHARHARVFDLFEELPFAGHPIIGAAAVLQHRADPGRPGTWTFDLAGRSVTVAVRYDGSHYSALLDQGAPAFLGTVDARDEVAGAFGLTPGDLVDGLPIEVASTGLRYLVVPLRPGRIGAARIAVDITDLVRRHRAQFAVLLDPATLEVRHWNNDGVIEDVATGSAAGVVGAYCHKHALVGAGAPFTLAQGRFAGRPSTLTVRVEHGGDRITRVLVGGGVAFVGRGTLDHAPAGPVERA